MKKINRREFIKSLAASGAALSLPNLAFASGQLNPKPMVSIVQIEKGNTDYAVRKAIDLIGGINHITKGKERIMLKPNLVSHEPRDVTKPEVIKVLARMMKAAGKDVSIGEGSAVGPPNIRPGVFGGVCQNKNVDELNLLQQIVFDSLGYSDLSKTLKTRLINLHTGKMASVKLPDGFVYKELMIHQELVDTDLLCSVPMMKTHGFAQVTLGMKNLFGLFPGQVYGTVRSAVHQEAAKIEPSGTASAIVDMVRANKLGLVVIDASTAMQAQGPSVNQGGRLVKMDLIIAGTNPLATDMVGASIMGFAPEEIPTFTWARKAGMLPATLDDIEIKGKQIAQVRQTFIRPNIAPWAAVSQFGPPC